MKRFSHGKVEYTITRCNDVRGAYKVERRDCRGCKTEYFNETPIYDWCDDDDYKGVEWEKHKAAKKYIINLFKKKIV